MVLTVSFVLSPVIGLFCHRRLAQSPARDLNASVEASGPHDFAVRLKRIRQSAIHVHRIPPRVRDDRDTPLQGGETALDMQVIWVGRKQKYFFRRDWTGRIALNCFDKLSRARTRESLPRSSICLLDPAALISQRTVQARRPASPRWLRGVS